MNYPLLILSIISLCRITSAGGGKCSNKSCCNNDDILRIDRALQRRTKIHNDKVTDDFNDRLNVLKFPMLYDANRRQDAINYVSSNYTKIYKNREYLQFDREIFKELLSSDILEVESEEVVFESVVEWIKNNCNDVENDINYLIPSIRFPLLSLKYIWNTVEPYVNTFEKSRPTFLDAVAWHIFPEERSSNTFKNYKPRKSKQDIDREKFLCVGSYDTKTAGIVEVYDADVKNWTKHLIDVQKHSYGAAIINNRLLIIGGYLEGSGAQKSVESYDLSTGEKTSLNSLNFERHYPASVVVGKGSDAVLYVFGGWGKGLLKSVERWDPVTQIWTLQSPMKYTRTGCAVALFNNKIYVAGGSTSEHGYSNTVEVFNPETNSWDSATSSINKNGYATMVATSKYLYLMGGYSSDVNAVSNVERYDPKTNTWITLPGIKSQGQVGGMVVDDKVVAVGGATNLVQSFDDDRRKWESLPSISVAREGHCMKIPQDTKLGW